MRKLPALQIAKDCGACPEAPSQMGIRKEKARTHLVRNHLQQVLRLLLVPCHVSIPRDAEGVRGDDLHAPKQLAQIGDDDLLQADEGVPQGPARETQGILVIKIVVMKIKPAGLKNE